MKKLIAYLRISALSGCAALAVSCTNYLDLNDPDSLSKGNFPTSIGHIDLLVNSVYGAQHHWCFLGNYWAGYVMYCLDHTIDLQWHNDQGWVDICSGAVKTGNNKVTDPWTALSMGVYYANTVMEEIDAYRPPLRRPRRHRWTIMRANVFSSGPSIGGTCCRSTVSPTWTAWAFPSSTRFPRHWRRCTSDARRRAPATRPSSTIWTGPWGFSRRPTTTV